MAAFSTDHNRSQTFMELISIIKLRFDNDLSLSVNISKFISAKNNKTQIGFNSYCGGTNFGIQGSAFRFERCSSYNSNTKQNYATYTSNTKSSL